MFVALGHVFSPPHVVDSLAFDNAEITVPTNAVLAFLRPPRTFLVIRLYLFRKVGHLDQVL
jgi:hypothetical protein